MKTLHKAIRKKPWHIEKVGNVSVRVYRRTRKNPHTGAVYYAHEIADYSNGKRVLRSISDPKKALREAKRIATKLAAGETAAASLRGVEAAAYGRAVESLRELGTTLEIAVAHYIEAVKIIGADRITEAARFFVQHQADRVIPKPVGDAVAELVEMRQSRGASRRYVGDLRARLGRFANAFKNVEISAITTADVQGWLDGLKLGSRTVRNFRCALGTLFKFAEARGYIAHGANPVERTEPITANGKGGAIEIFTPPEMAKLLAAAAPGFLPFLAIGGFAGLRSAEIERLEWADVDLAGGFIHVAADKAKTQSRRLVPIAPNLSQWLAPYARKRGAVWTGTERELLKARAETCKAAGVEWKDNGLRHSFISYRLAEIQNAAQVALEAGNSPQMVFRHYRELVKPDAAKAWFAIAPQAAGNVITLRRAAVANG